MTAIPVRVAGELTIRLEDLPVMAKEQICAALTVVNEEKEKAATLKTFGWWDMPDTIALYRIELRRGGDQVLCLPRGFASSLATGLTSMGLKAVWDDQRTKAPAAPGYFRPFVLRDYQFEAALALLAAEQGIYSAPAGSGKTVTCLGAMAWVQQRALVIVDTLNLANQWRVRAHEFYGMPLEQVTQEDGTTELVAPLEGERVVGLIGSGVWEERDLTICLRQTLFERHWQLDATGWWSNWGLTLLDEVHHASADSLAEISRKIPSYYFMGASATPSKSPAKGAIVAALVGPIVAETTRQVLYDRKVLMKSTIEVLNGDLEVTFWPDHDAKFDNKTQRWKCLKPDCRMQRKHAHRNNYSSCLKALVEDEDRNARIAQRILADRGHIHLVPSGQLKHLNLIKRALEAAGWPKDKIWVLRGEENAKGLDQQIAQAVQAADEGVLLSSVAKEALDIPPIDRVHIVFPMRDAGATIQLVGRGERVCPPRKTDSIVVDYREPRVDVFEGQWDARRETYRGQGFLFIDSPHSVVASAEPEQPPQETAA